METRRQDRDILSHQFRGQQGGGTSTHVAPWCERERDRDWRERKKMKREKEREREWKTGMGDRKEKDRKREKGGTERKTG